MSGKPGRTGHPWRPTERERGNVEGMAACGITEERIAAVLGIAPKTLRRHCRIELDTAKTRAHALVGNWILGSILGRESVANRIMDERARASLAIFFAKTQMRWAETVRVEGEIRAPDDDKEAVLDRVSRLIAAGTSAADTPAPVAPISKRLH